MTTPDHQSPESQPAALAVKDRVYRSSAGMAGGVLLLAVVLWLGIDALTQGSGRTPWLALALMIFIVPLIVTFTLRPAVFAGDERLRVRNPFRVITLPWGQIATLRSGYSNEVIDKSGTKYQLWSIPVSLRARKKAAQRESRAALGAVQGRDTGSTRGRGHGAETSARAAGDQAMDELREIQDRHERSGAPQTGEVTVRWAYEIAAPVVAGAVLLVILLAIG